VAVDRHNPVFAVQLLTYLLITGLRLGVVVNFGACAASQCLFLIADIAKSIQQYGGRDLGFMVKYAP
jgi:predicted transporter